ncbi:MAG TPA: hypothetical protein VLF39_00235 [Candidatus Saccharimonadales bacterium]|nr:hypothetical protein [Candidatus Saccharimonadales bacterium]
MKAVVLYHPNSDHARIVEDYSIDFKKNKNHELKPLSLETPEGSETAKLYDILSYPAILVTQNDGQLIKDWQGLPLPLMDEVAAYAA